MNRVCLDRQLKKCFIDFCPKMMTVLHTISHKTYKDDEGSVHGEGHQ